MDVYSIQQGIHDYLSTVIADTEQDKINICAWVYKKISTSNEHALEMFRYFLENADDIESNKTVQADVLFSENDVKEYRKKYGALTDALFEKTLAENCTETLFYEKLWQGINETILFESENARVFALYYIWIDVRIPYYQLDEGLSMTNQRFAEITEEIREDIKKARFIVKTNKYEQRTNRASELLKVIEAQPSFENRTVLLAHIITFLRPTLKESLLRDLLRIKDVESQELT